MLRLGALTTVYVNNKNNTAHISKKERKGKKRKRRRKEKNKTLSAKGRGQRGGSVRDLEAVWNWRQSQVPTENQIRRLTRWFAAFFFSFYMRWGFRSNTQPSSQLTRSCIIVSELRRVAVRSPPCFTFRIPSSQGPGARSWTNTPLNEITTRAGNTETAPPPATLPPRWQKVQLHDFIHEPHWEVSL